MPNVPRLAPSTDAEHPLAIDLERITALSANDWRSLAGARLFITGGTGFFGTWLVEAFAWANRHLKLGASLTVLSRAPDRFLAKFPHIAHEPGIDFIRGDVRSFEFGHPRFTHVVHAATATSGPAANDDPESTYSVITEGTHRVLRMCREHGVQRSLLVSSGAVYGRQPTTMTHIPETWHGGPDQTDASAAYAEGKRAAELLAAIYTSRYGIDVPIARCFAFVGPHLALDAHFAIGNFIADVLHGRDVVVKGDGSPVRSYLHAADLVIWLLAILVRGQGARPYNVGGDEPYSIRNVAECVITAGMAVFPDHPASRLVVEAPRLDDVPGSRYVPDCTRARSELGLPEPWTLREAVLATLRFHRGQRTSSDPSRPMPNVRPSHAH